MDFNINADAATASADRFKIAFRNATLLPVNFSSVKAYQKNNNIIVDWKVENEIAIEKYELEKSVDGKNFATVNVRQAIMANTPANYSWEDLNVISGNKLYRIKSICIGCEIKNSRIEKVI